MRPTLPVLATFAALAACASTGGSDGGYEPRVTSHGTYEFSASIMSRAVSGRLRVLPDTILVDSESGDCGRVTSDSRYFNVSCRGMDVLTMDENRAVTGAILKFDRGNPGQGAKWVGNFPVQRRRQVCARYEVRNGREVCASMKTETYEDLEPKTGPVQVRRVQQTD